MRGIQKCGELRTKDNIIAMKTLPKAIFGLFTIGGFLLAVALATPANATTFTLTDLNSSAQINDASQAGMSNWTVNGVNQLSQQWFWFRVGSSGAQASIDTLPLVSAIASDTNANPGNDTLTLRYGSATTFFIDIKYTLNGSASSGSDMGEQISITNKSTTSPLDFHFFQYTNFDLNGTPAGDNVTLLNSNTVRQSKGSTVIAETVTTPAANHYELGLTTDSPNTLFRLNNVNGLTLNDQPTGPNPTRGPGDATWAFEWDPTIGANSTFQISKDKNLSIPEPGTSALIITVGTAFAGLSFLRKLSRRC
jgi:hypothetical protein